MDKRIVLGDNLIKRIEEICKKRNITFEQFCTKAMFIIEHSIKNNKKIDEEESKEHD